jgi:hypothetical protein
VVDEEEDGEGLDDTPVIAESIDDFFAVCFAMPAQCGLKKSMRM